MTKLLLFILAFIVLTGSSFPCCTGDNCQDETTTSSSSNEKPYEKGACSPFFACGNCAGFTLTTRHISVPLPVIEGTDHYERIVVFFASTYYSSFFQPPRLS
jgi:hypothetical protein